MISDDNVFLMPPRRFVPGPVDPARRREAMLGVRHLRGWWDDNRDRLDWQPIANFVKMMGHGAYAEPRVLRNGDEWTYGVWAEGAWRRWLEGCTIELEGFEPTEWADVDLDDAILLGQE